MNVQNYLLDCQHRVNQSLKSCLPSTKAIPSDLHKAMRYSVLNGGKRIRSALIYATGEALQANVAVLSKVCSAVELIHAFSLVHDDLPALDNDDLRRGVPTCHKAFDEATAILTGDALLALAFEVLAEIPHKNLSAHTQLKMIKILSHYIGSCGMAGGEALDIAIKDKQVDLKKLALIYKLKTSYLICASVMLAALAANCDNKTILHNLEYFGLYAGLAFQIHDDIIGVETDTQLLGKTQNSDEINHKPTYPQVVGMQRAKQEEVECYNKAIQFLKKVPVDQSKLVAICEYLIKRVN